MEHLILSTPPAVAEAFYAICYGVCFALLLLILGSLIGAVIFVIRGYREDAILKIGFLSFVCMLGFFWLHSSETMRWYFWKAVHGKWVDPGFGIGHLATWALMMFIYSCTLYVLFAKHPSAERFDRRPIVCMLLYFVGSILLIRHWNDIGSSGGSTGTGVSWYREHTYLSVDSRLPFLHHHPHPDAEPFLDAIGGVTFLTGEAFLVLAAVFAVFVLGSRWRNHARNPGGILAGCLLVIAIGRGAMATLKHNPIAPSPTAIDVPSDFRAPSGSSKRIRYEVGPLYLMDRSGHYETELAWPEDLLIPIENQVFEDPWNGQRYNDDTFEIPRFLIDRRTGGETVEALLQRCLSFGIWNFGIVTRCERCDIVRDSFVYLLERESVKHVIAWERGSWALDGQSFRQFESVVWPPQDFRPYRPMGNQIAIDVRSAPSWQHIVDLVDWMTSEYGYFEGVINLMVPAEKL